MIILIVKQHYNWIKKYIQKTAKHLRWSFLLEIASGWNLLANSTKTGLQVRKIGDDTDNKETSKLT